MKAKYYAFMIAAISVAIIIASCDSQQQQSSQDNSQSATAEQGRPQTASKECSSVYDGTYQGIFTYDYKIWKDYYKTEVLKSGTEGIRVSLTLKCSWVNEENDQVYLDITQVIASHPHFECQVGGCVPLQDSHAVLPLNPPTTSSKPSKSGEGIWIFFPNDATLSTNNAEGALLVGFNGQTLSNALTGVDSMWHIGTIILKFPGTEGEVILSLKSWTLSKTT